MPKFEKGKSGNPGGTPGSIGTAKRDVEILLLSRKSHIVKAILDKALDGDVLMLRAILPFIMPKRSDTPHKELKGIAKKDLKEKIEMIQTAMEEGRLSPLECIAALDVVEKSVNLVEIKELQDRIEAIEGKL